MGRVHAGRSGMGQGKNKKLCYVGRGGAKSLRIFPAPAPPRPAPFAIPRDNLEEAGQVITCNQSIYNLCCVMSLIIGLVVFFMC